MHSEPSLNLSGNSKVKIFISYSGRNTELKDELLTQLKVLTIADKQLEIWEDGLLEPGIQWDDEIKKKLHEAHIVIMLVSAQFLTTDYIWNIEVEQTMHRQKQGEVTAIPVILSPCAWMQTPLSQFTALPRKARPITGFPDRDSAMMEVVTGLQAVVKSWKNKLQLV